MVGEGYDAFWSASRWGIWPSKMPTYRGTWVKIFKKVKCPGVYPFTGGERWFWIRHFHISHNAPYLPLPPPPPKKDFASALFSICLGTSVITRRNEKQRLWNIWGGEQIMCIMENVKVAYWLEHKCNVLIFVQKSQGAAGDVKPVPEPEDSSPVKPANNSSGCVVSWTIQNHKHLKLGPNVELFMRRTKVSELSSWKARRLAQLSSCKWVWIVKLKHALSVRFRR